MLSEEQAQAIKQQIIQQIKNTFPPEKQQESINKLQSMSSEQLEQFLKQNKMIQSPSTNQEPIEKIVQNSSPKSTTQQPQEQQCIFCLIKDNQIPSYKIDENKQAIAVLEINPISKGHSIIIPKKHIQTNDKLPQQTFSLAKKISKKLKSKLKPKPQDVKLLFSNMFGHEIINILPIYKNETLASERYKESEENLKKLQKKLEKKTRKTTKPKTKAKSKKTKPKKSKETTPWLPRRIP